MLVCAVHDRLRQFATDSRKVGADAGAQEAHATSGPQVDFGTDRDIAQRYPFAFSIFCDPWLTTLENDPRKVVPAR